MPCINIKRKRTRVDVCIVLFLKSGPEVLDDSDDEEEEIELESETEPSDVLNDDTKDEVLGGVRPRRPWFQVRLVQTLMSSSFVLIKSSLSPLVLVSVLKYAHIQSNVG